MATSSFSKEFIIKDPKAVEQLIEMLENPTPIKLDKRNYEQEEKEALWALKERLDSLKS